MPELPRDHIRHLVRLKICVFTLDLHILARGNLIASGFAKITILLSITYSKTEPGMAAVSEKRCNFAQDDAQAVPIRYALSNPRHGVPAEHETRDLCCTTVRKTDASPRDRRCE